MKDRAISLKTVKDILKMANMEEFDIVAYRNIMQLPPVKPQEPKTGHWIHDPIISDKSITGYFLSPRCHYSEMGGDDNEG